MARREGLLLHGPIHGVSSSPGIWHHAKVEVTQPTLPPSSPSSLVSIAVSVDGRPLPLVATPDFEAQGGIGFASYNFLGRGNPLGVGGQFANVSVHATRDGGPLPWTSAPLQRPYRPVSAGLLGSNLVKFKSGEIAGLCRSPAGLNVSSPQPAMLRSSSNGLNWVREPMNSGAAIGKECRLLRVAADGSTLEAYCAGVRSKVADPSLPFTMQRMKSSGETNILWQAHKN